MKLTAIAARVAHFDEVFRLGATMTHPLIGEDVRVTALDESGRVTFSDGGVLTIPNPVCMYMPDTVADAAERTSANRPAEAEVTAGQEPAKEQSSAGQRRKPQRGRRVDPRQRLGLD
jgi:hypothetical protein